VMQIIYLPCHLLGGLWQLT